MLRLRPPLAANAAVERVLRNLKERGTSVSPDIPLYDFQHFGRINGFDEVYAFEAKWRRDPAPKT